MSFEILKLFLKNWRDLGGSKHILSLCISSFTGRVVVYNGNNLIFPFSIFGLPLLGQRSKTRTVLSIHSNVQGCMYDFFLHSFLLTQNHGHLAERNDQIPKIVFYRFNIII